MKEGDSLIIFPNKGTFSSIIEIDFSKNSPKVEEDEAIKVQISSGYIDEFNSSELITCLSKTFSAYLLFRFIAYSKGL